MLEDGKVILSFVAFALKQIGTIKFSENFVKPLASVDENAYLYSKKYLCGLHMPSKMSTSAETSGLSSLFFLFIVWMRCFWYLEKVIY